MNANMEQRLIAVEKWIAKFDRERGIFPVGYAGESDAPEAARALALVAEKFKVSVRQIKGHCRRQEIVRARWLAVWLLAEFNIFHHSGIARCLKKHPRLVKFTLESLAEQSSLPTRDGELLRAQMAELKKQFQDGFSQKN